MTNTHIIYRPGDRTKHILFIDLEIGRTTYLPDIERCENGCRTLPECRLICSLKYINLNPKKLIKLKI